MIAAKKIKEEKTKHKYYNNYVYLEISEKKTMDNTKEETKNETKRNEKQLLI